MVKSFKPSSDAYKTRSSDSKFLRLVQPHRIRSTHSGSFGPAPRSTKAQMLVNLP